VQREEEGGLLQCSVTRKVVTAVQREEEGRLLQCSVKRKVTAGTHLRYIVHRRNNCFMKYRKHLTF
jgi:hypothetical protein